MPEFVFLQIAVYVRLLTTADLHGCRCKLDSIKMHAKITCGSILCCDNKVGECIHNTEEAAW